MNLTKARQLNISSFRAANASALSFVSFIFIIALFIIKQAVS